eukprot:1889990-Rhodomonas_salina.2
MSRRVQAAVPRAVKFLPHQAPVLPASSAFRSAAAPAPARAAAPPAPFPHRIAAPTPRFPRHTRLLFLVPTHPLRIF